jgi:hypothetical protein
MSHPNCFPAELTEAHAVYYPLETGKGLLVIHAKGNVIDALHEMEIDICPKEIYPQEYDLNQYDPCKCEPRVVPITPREACGYFFLSEGQKTVKIHASNGDFDIPVVLNGECACTQQ